MYIYRVSLYTGKQSWAGTNANVFLTIHGTRGKSETFTFQNEGHSTFESGMKNTFTVDTKRSMGNLTKVNVGHDNTGINPGWFLEKVEVLDANTGELSEFECYKWFDTETNDRRIRRDVRRSGISMEIVQTPVEKTIVVEEQDTELEASMDPFEGFEELPPVEEEEPQETIETPVEQIIVIEVRDNELEASMDPFEGFEELPPVEDPEPQETSHEYTLTFHTGSMAFAGTNANVFVTLYGKYEQADEYKFDNKARNSLFEKGMKNSFPIVSKIALENITQLRVGHDNTGVFPGWYIIKVVLENNSTGEKVQFPCNRWLEDATWVFENKISCLLTRDDVDNVPALTPHSPKGETNEGFDTTDLSTEMNRLTQPFSNDENKKSTVQFDFGSDLSRLTPVIPDEDTDQFGEKEYLYTVHIVAEVSYGALSDDHIIFTLYGKDGQSEKQIFDQSERTSEKRMRDTIEIRCSKDLGPLEKIKIGLDKAEGTLPWILVLVVDHQLNENVVFICDCCLTNDKQANVQHEYFRVFDDAKSDVMALDKDACKDWTTVKYTKDADVRSRNANLPNTPPIIKAVLKLDDIAWPYQTAVTNFTDWEKRKKWDKTLSNVNILEKIENLTLVQCSLKMPLLVKSREVVLACLDHCDQRYYMQTMCNASHPRALINNKKIRAKSFRSGIILHESASEPKSASITIISQIELGGWIPPMVKADYLTNAPIKQLEFLKEYVTQNKASIKSGNTNDRKSDLQSGSEEDPKLTISNGI